MIISEVIKLSPLDRFLYWIGERNQIYRNKTLNREKPWTNDEILQSQFFTNITRERDKVTVWFRENVRDPLKNSPDVVFATIAFRWFNYIPTGEMLIRPSLKQGMLVNWNLKHAINRLLNLDGQVFTGAFNISNSGSTKPKINRVCEDYIQPVWEDIGNLVEHLLDCKTLTSAHKIISSYPGLGGSGFMAAQVICDLAYTYVLERAEDWHEWSSPGPGSKRGLNRLLERSVDAPSPKGAAWHKEITKLRTLVNKRLNMGLHARDIQNCLCEYDKYVRVLMNEGRSKRTYNGK